MSDDNSNRVTQPARIRKCYRLCHTTLQNSAYYRGGASVLTEVKMPDQFAIVSRNNFLEVAILNWCKLFADAGGKHHYKKVILDAAKFETRLSTALKMELSAFEDAAKAVAHYRNKEIAHADVYYEIDIPRLDLLIESTIQLYKALRDQCGEEPTPIAPSNLHATFQREQDIGRSNFLALSRVNR